MLIDPNNLKAIVEHMQNGGLIAYPTDSSYAIGCDATKGKAVLKIFELKKREKNKPLIVLCCDTQMAISWLDVNDYAKNLAKHYPAKLSIIVKNKRLASNLSPNGNVAFRVPDLTYARQLVKRYGRPLVGTSANISGEKNIYDSKELEKLFPQILIIDYGKIPESPHSTIIDSFERKIVRQGAFNLEEEEVKLAKKEEKKASKAKKKK